MGNLKSKLKKSKTQRGKGKNKLNNSVMMANPDFQAYNTNNSRIVISSYNKHNLFPSYSLNPASPNTKIKTFSFIPGNWFPIAESQINVGLGWDFDRSEAYDLDASVTAFNECNHPIESIYYGKLNSLNGEIHHFGDYLTGVGDGDDEIISIDLRRILENVIFLAVTVNSYKSNSLIKAKEAFIRLFETHSKREIGKLVLNKQRIA